MNDEELIKSLRGWHMLEMHTAADRIEEFGKERADIRESALREAAAVAEALEIKWWKEYKERLSPHCADPQYQGMSDGAGDVAAAILALIGEKND